MIVNKPKKKKELSRYSVYIIIMAIIFIVIGAKLVYLQVIRHDDYKERADTTSTKFVSEKAPRGIIYDSEGNILATNIQTYTMTYTNTTDTNSTFFETINSVESILKENGESIIDNFILKLDDNNKPYFEYSSTDESDKEAEKLRFLKDRGFDEEIKKELFGDNAEDLTDKEIDELNNRLLEISAEDAFYELIKKYNLIEIKTQNLSDEEKEKYKKMTGEEMLEVILNEGITYEKLRTYMMIRDELKMQSFSGYKYVTLAENMKRDTSLIILQKLNDLPGIEVTLEPTRYYPYSTLASSVLGYLSSINSSNKEKYELRGYDVSSDYIGISGIESAFEEQLRGTKGGTTVKINSKGRVTEELFKLESYPGNNVHLTIDKNIQYAAEQALADTMEKIRTTSSYTGATRGAAIAVEVKTGRILASVSYPNYDPNIFTVDKEKSADLISSYFSPDLETFGQNLINSRGISKNINELFPLENGVRTDSYDLYPRAFYNYATQGLIPPGSTFKPLTGVAGIESGVVGVSETIYDSGKFNVHPETYGKSFGPECLLYTNYHSSHGATDITHALEVSCNYYFYEVAYRLYKQAGSDINALDSLAKYAWKFGLGVDPDSNEKPSTGIEIEENFGQVYNFQSFKNQSILYSKFELRDYLERGDYRGITTFIPFDYSTSEDDNEKVKDAKATLKKKINERFTQIGVDDDALNTDEFSEYILDDVKTIMNNSEKYEENVKAYEANNKTFNLDSQSKTVADVIARFVINDKGAEIVSPAQEVYAAIGQGMNNFTPMQLAGYVSTLANGGTRYKLHFVDKVTTPDGELVEEFNPEVLDELNISEATLAAVREGMYKANNDEGGTAAAVFSSFPIRTGGKTGTADFGESQTEVGRAPYATYISFAPLEDPQIAFVGVIYDGGHGSSTAPVAKAVYEAYFKDVIETQYPGYAASSTTYQKYVVNAPKDNKTEE
ncbi:penicillin-binding protein 2 [Clostridium sp. DSM 8431]|uniref:penicillin-binding transpeptidase domain-containing protein n=1 Tax=Clostridium sp. DSM 8431 TaxID=1761781 RepID=UPI0008F20ADE|nr:penicillin-binding transpeptidase domain-containing protein [Clostridium sp. DSM 8431]SFU50357.1 penicillin-binding protein 2 [Clostridium sp. DSM 8431]